MSFGYKSPNDQQVDLGAIFRDPRFGPAVRAAIQTPSVRSNFVDRSVPQMAVDIPMVTGLPRGDQKNGAEVNLVIGDDIDRYVFLRSLNQWVRINDDNTAPVATLPSTNLREGQVAIFDTGQNGVRWQFVYDSSDGTTYPWLFVGGPPMTTIIATDQSRASASYGDLGTVGPAVTLPFNGDYYITAAASMYSSVGGQDVLMTYEIGATAASDEWCAQLYSITNVYPHSAEMTYLHTARTAAEVVTAKYRTPTGTANYRNRRISVLPLRVGV